MIGSTIASSTEDGLDKLAKHARGVLILLAVIQLAGAAILYIAGGMQTTELGVALVLGALFGALAVWARRNPLPAVLVGLGLYVALVLVSALVDPTTIYNGLIMKFLVGAMFWNGISTGLTYNEMKRTFAPPR